MSVRTVHEEVHLVNRTISMYRLCLFYVGRWCWNWFMCKPYWCIHSTEINLSIT